MNNFAIFIFMDIFAVNNSIINSFFVRNSASEDDLHISINHINFPIRMDV